MSLIINADAAGIAQAVERLLAGKLVALPTETVYGLGADATNDHAVASIFEAKGRPSFNPLIVHYAFTGDAAQDVVFDQRAETLASLFWPGPLTMILPRREDARVSLLCSAGLPTLAVRVPAHPVAHKVLEDLGRPIAAPSANKSGTISPTTPQHVAESLGEAAGMILAAGRAVVGLESTVMDLTGTIPVILRPGAVTPEDIQMHIGEVTVELQAKEGAEVKSPGQLLRHYAPKTPLRLSAIDVRHGEALLAFGSLRFMGMQGGGFAKDLPEDKLLNLSPSGDLNEAAANLFAMLRRLDTCGHTAIAVMDIPKTGLGLAINDRLRRAAGA